MGITGSGATEEPTMVPDQHKKIVNFFAIENYAVLLDEDGKVWTTGNMTYITTQTSFVEFDIKKVIAADDKVPGDEKDKIVKLSASP